ncbi:MAG: tryptophan synthase subunit alpha [Planctomycetes bacterium]|nr:tryptophan synthase subunit alpha [Planctomycetota bacterium]MBL7107287.1 tryptophan synthase subunit alpha [Phycisphaerae bacterium]
MKSYSELFSELDRTALIPFFMIGDPDYDTGLEIVKTAIDSGADILELGIAFSDPIADGPTIQKAGIRAMRSGMTVKRAIEFIKEVKDYKDIPIGLLMYYNLIYQYGSKEFFEDCCKSGVNSVLVADMNIDNAKEVADLQRSAGLDTVFMVTPNTRSERIERIAAQTNGFIYSVSLLGVTGSREKLSDTVKGLIEKLKGLTDVPVCVGFGISSAEHAVQIARSGADGVIIGSKIVKMIEENLDDKQKMLDQISSFISDVKSALAAI